MTYARSKGYVLIFSFLLSLVVLLSWSQTWVSLTFSVSASSAPQQLTGEFVAPALPGLIFLNSATIAVIAISGKLLRKILSGVLMLSGLGIFILSVNVISDPVNSSLSQLSVLTGINNPEELTSLVEESLLTPWPFISAASSLLLIATSVVIFFTSAKWLSSSRKYDTSTQDSASVENAPQSEKNISQWDTLSQGSDPTTD
jgi:uncharacterized membrane protein (TIGR02234 family)